MNNNSSNSDDQIMSELNKQYDQADEQKEKQNKPGKSDNNYSSNRTTKLVVGILMIIIAACLPFVSMFVGLVNTIGDTGDVGGTAGSTVSLFWLASGIVLIATHNRVNKKGGEIAVLVMMILAWLSAICNCAIWQDLAILGWLSFLIGFGFFYWKMRILNFSTKGKIIFYIATGIALVLGIGANYFTLTQVRDNSASESKSAKTAKKDNSGKKLMNKSRKIDQNNKAKQKKSSNNDQSDNNSDDNNNTDTSDNSKEFANCSWNPKTLTLTTNTAIVKETYATVAPDDIDNNKKDLVLFIDITNNTKKPHKIDDIFESNSIDDVVTATQQTTDKIAKLDIATSVDGSIGDAVDKRTDNMMSEDKILPGKTTKGVLLWELQDKKNPVHLKFTAHKDFDDKVLGTQTIPLQR